MDTGSLKGTIHDDLTGLVGISAFRDKAAEILRLGTMPWKGTSVIIYLNIENFKLFNSKYGFEKGNELLQNFSNLVQEVFFERLAARFAEDNFYVFAEREYVEEKVDRIADELRLMGRGMTLELCGGIYEITEKNTDVIRACDLAKIAGDSIKKKYGINWRFFDEELDEQFSLSQYIVENIDNAIEAGHIKVYYQPVVRTINDDICDLEALARWDDPVHGLLSPKIFINVLEEYHLIHKLDAFIVQKVCLHYKHCMQRGNPIIPVSINLSRMDFELCDIFQVINQAVYENKVPKNMIHIEVKESVLSQNEEYMKEQINRFHREGYQVWLDNFGSSNSSLKVLKEFDIDVLKIDMKFLNDFSEKSRSVLVSVVHMVKSLGIQTLAEGVETKEQLDFLRSIGCEKVQGYHYSRPMFYWDLVRHISERGLFVELPGDRKYFDDISRTDMLGIMTLLDDDKTNDINTHGISLAIVERKNDVYRVMNCNDNFRRIMNNIGFGEIAEAERAFSKEAGSLYLNLTAMFEKAEASGKPEVFDFVWKGFYCSGKAKFLSSGRDASAVLISLVNLSDDVSYIQRELLEEAGHNLFTAYRAVSMVDIPDDQRTIIYQSYKFKSESDTDSARESFRNFCKNEIYPEDQSRFGRFMDLDTMIERIRKGGTNFINECFRTRGVDGNYEWSEYGIIRIDEVNERCLIYNRVLNGKDIKRIAGESKIEREEDENEITAEILWKNAVATSGLNFFWKDADRKFLGASKAFLDYYGFSSIDEIKGKNDEEMGWHVNPERFRNDEQMVLETGQKTRRVPGKCVAGGKLRDIVASKTPIYKDGKIVGLMGHFVDVSKQKAEQKRIKLLSYSDELTGTMNMRGLMDSGLRYVESYDFRSLDFAMIILDIMDFHRLNGLYGHDWGNMCLKCVADRILECIGVRGITSRPGGARFIVLYQFKDRRDVEELEKELKEEVEKIQKIGELSCTLYASIGSAYYSDCESIERLHQNAMDMMLSNKKKMDS